MNTLTPTVDGNLFTSYGGGATAIDRRHRRLAAVGRPKPTWPHRSCTRVTPCSAQQARDVHRLEDGAVLDSDRKFGEYWSMVARGDEALVLDERALLKIVFKPDAFEIIEERKVSKELLGPSP